MKLIFCVKCYDIVRLQHEPRECACERSSGRYIDDLNASISGPCIPLGFANTSFINALREQKRNGDKDDGFGREFTAFVIPESAPSVVRVDDYDVYKEIFK